MRAMSMRRLVGAAAAGLLIAATFLGTTAPAFAAVPTATVHDEALPAQFTAGDDVGFRSTFDEQDTSSLSKLYLVFNVNGASSNSYLSAIRTGSDVTKSACTAGVPVTCQFKNVRPGEHIVVTAGFVVASGATQLSAQSVWSTSGQTTSDGGTSHGDSWTDLRYNNPPLHPDALTSTLTDNADFGGGFSSLLGSTIGNGQVVTALNRQATKVAGLPAGVAATVLDGDTASGACGPYDCTNAIGTWSEVTVGDGQTFGSPFQIVITYYQGTPKSFVHQYSDGNGGFLYELVGACPKKNPAGSAPCFTWNAKTSQATILTFHNGSWRGL
jgi:hypothetical protein